MLLQQLIFKTPWKELRVERRTKEFCALGKTCKIGLQIIRYFQESIFWAHSCISSIYKSTKILHGDDCSLWLAVTLCKKYFPVGSEVKSVCLQCGRPGFDPWVRKIPWRRKWHPTPVFLPRESHGQRSLVGYSPRVTKSRTRLSDFTFTFTLSVYRMLFQRYFPPILSYIFLMDLF